MTEGREKGEGRDRHANRTTAAQAMYLFPSSRTGYVGCRSQRSSGFQRSLLFHFSEAATKQAGLRLMKYTGRDRTCPFASKDGLAARGGQSCPGRDKSEGGPLPHQQLTADGILSTQLHCVTVSAPLMICTEKLPVESTCSCWNLFECSPLGSGASHRSLMRDWLICAPLV